MALRNANPTFSFSPIELRDLLKAWAATALAFTIFFLRGGMLSIGEVSFFGFLIVFLIAAVTGGVGFVLHELAHKVAAHRFRVHGEFRSNDTMLILSVVFALFGVLFAAPGAVHLFGMVSRRESGIISAAGPAANILLAILCLPAAAFGTGIVGDAARIGLLLNAILGAFNLIPAWNFDGAKVIAWSKGWYAAMLAVAIGLVIVAYATLGAF